MSTDAPCTNPDCAVTRTELGFARDAYNRLHALVSAQKKNRIIIEMDRKIQRLEDQVATQRRALEQLDADLRGGR